MHVRLFDFERPDENDWVVVNQVSVVDRTTGTGQERIPELGWNVVSYVFHVAENTRIWSERLAASAFQPGAPITTWDEDALDAARGSSGSSLVAGLWSLERALDSWWDVADLGVAAIVAHPDQGPMTFLDVGRAAAHELHHHALDIERIVC